MTVLVVRLSGSYEEAGIFGIANSICNIFFVISCFSVRNYQVADINNKFTNGEYITFRFITCAISLIALTLYLIIMRYSLYIIGTVICFMLLKNVEALVDVFHGIFQKAWRLDIACKSFVLRGILNLAVFSISEYLLKNLVVSMLLTAIASLVCALLVDFKLGFSLFKIKIQLNNKRLLKLFLLCLPLFFHGILNTLIANIPRLTAQKMLGEELFGYYSSVATPAIAVQLAAANIFSPCIPLLSEQYMNKDKIVFKTILKMILIVLSIGLCALVGFEILGDWFLNLLFGEKILAYSYLLLPAIFVSVLTALSWYTAALFTVVEKNVAMVISEGVITVITIILSQFLIGEFGLQGINWTLISAYLLFIIIGFAIIILSINKNIKGI